MTPEEMADLAHLRRARDLMDREYAQPLDVPAMARAALMSPAHFSRKFRAAYGETPYSYLMTRRIERAKALLRQGMSVTDTCFAASLRPDSGQRSRASRATRRASCRGTGARAPSVEAVRATATAVSTVVRQAA